MREILVNVEPREVRSALLVNGVLHDLWIDRPSQRTLTGSLYRGKVQNVLRTIQSAFIDIGEEENGFIHISDLLENDEDLQERFGIEVIDSKKAKRILSKQDIAILLKANQPVLVQVVKEPMQHKGARLTANISIPGRYLVFLPRSAHAGISRKIVGERDRLKKLVNSFNETFGTEGGWIARTASAKVSNEVLTEEGRTLAEHWKKMLATFESGTQPICLHQEGDALQRVLDVALEKQCSRVLVDNAEAYRTLCDYLNKESKNDLHIEWYRDPWPLFDKFGVEREVARALSKKVWLPSGGYLLFESTEAMHTIDVNSGRSTNRNDQQSLDESFLHINMEAATEIAHQLRVRNLGGLIICDFIDLNSKKHKAALLAHFQAEVREDSARCTVLGMSEFGLVEMTRQRHKHALEQIVCTSCPYCTGTGWIQTEESTLINLHRLLRRVIISQQQFGIRVALHPKVLHTMGEDGKKELQQRADTWNARLEFHKDDALHLNEVKLYSTLNGTELPI